MNENWKKYLNVIALPLAYSSVAALLTLTLNIGINFAVIFALYYILGQKFDKKIWPLFSVVFLGTLISQYLAFAGLTGVILIFIVYAFLGKAILNLDTKNTVILGIVMALLAYVGTTPQIGGTAMQSMEVAGKAMAGVA